MTGKAKRGSSVAKGLETAGVNGSQAGWQAGSDVGLDTGPVKPEIETATHASSPAATLPPGTVAIFGAGHIGCYVGARLAQAGVPVQFIGRARVMAQLHQHGLEFSDLGGARGCLPAADLRLAEDAAAAAGADVVLVCVKAGATATAGAALARVLQPGAVVLSLQNGLANAETLRLALPQQVVLPGMVAFNVVPSGPGAFHQASAGGLAAQDHPALRA